MDRRGCALSARSAAACLLALALAPEAYGQLPGPLAPPRPRRLAVTASVLVAPGSRSAAGSRTFTEFHEPAEVRTGYAFGSGRGFDVSLDYTVGRRLGLRAALAHDTRSGSAELTATLPHPLYFGQPRTARQSLAGLTNGSSGLHLGLSVHASARPLGFVVFAGPSLVQQSPPAAADDALRYRQSYPFDEVVLEPVPVRTVSRTLTGVHAGAAIEGRLSRRIGLTLQARFVRARGSLSLAPGSTLSLESGGVDVALGLTFR